eukprot:TRINITY_DN973_c0_g1_i1.p1 TRINITY_DN973_c0_g1~~TRINITY_DN973_c0_g1_i1.p1  ORF type:complete len:184 (-),score=71.47 TRINITY_DN973_c0_g1_i1:91-597(-)
MNFKIIVVILFLLLNFQNYCLNEQSKEEEKEKDLAWNSADQVYTKCLQLKVSKISCSRIQDSVEEIIDGYGKHLQQFLNVTDYQIQLTIKTNEMSIKWETMLNNFAKLGLNNEIVDDDENLKASIMKDFQNLFLQILTYNPVSSNNANTIDEFENEFEDDFDNYKQEL